MSAPALSPADQVAAWGALVKALPSDRIPMAGFLWRAPGAPVDDPPVWPEVRRAMLVFLRDRGVEAVEHGWDAIGLFGVHRLAAAVRVDACGAMILLYPRTVVAISATEFVTERSGVRQTHRGVPNRAESVPIWEFAKAEART
ncbi:hypothetical protein [Methylobacterium sp. CCH5-D2]|uniref:hypothetical protein n=1 Tax=Methylobacterium sp. CCH5-D2 TaxID=1768765 RepID=UPI000A4791D3|nr:hypothetical protein [Methylobacterium sp. CCH5-D2]